MYFYSRQITATQSRRKHGRWGAIQKKMQQPDNQTALVSALDKQMYHEVVIVKLKNTAD